MALTDTQRADVRNALGWSARFHQFDSRLEQAMNGLDTSPEDETLVIALLASVADIKTKLVSSHGRLKASVVGSIKLNAVEVQMLRNEGARFTNEMASLLGVGIRHNIFSNSPARDFAGFGGMSGGGGNYIGK